MSALVKVLFIAFLSSNEAARLTSRSQSRMMMRAHKHAQLAADMAAMPMDNALDILRSSNYTSYEFMSFVQSHVRHHTRHHAGHKKHRKGKHLRRDHAKGVPVPDEGADYGTGTKNAVIKINEMILETIEKMDAEEIRCEARFEELEQLLVEIEEDLNTFQVGSSETVASKMDSRSAISNYNTFISQTRFELSDHKAKCAAEATDLSSQIAIIKSDMGVMEKILNMTKCSDDSVNKAATLLQCTDETGQHYTRIKASKDLAEQFDKLHHASSRQLVDRHVVDSTALLQRVVPKGMYGNMNTSDSAVVYPDQAEKCSISNSSNCPELRERFMNIAGGIADAHEEMEFMIGNQQTRCQTINGNIERELEHYRLYMQQQQGKEAQATADFTAAEKATTEKNVQKRDTLQILREEREQCTNTEKELKNEECALNKIRDQLLNMSNLERHIIDCEVTTPWEYGQCSASCAGGVRTLTRDIDVQAGPGPELWQKGHLCPAQKAQQPCNTDRCPVNCDLSEWAEWGHCSKVCDGGSRERMRRVLQPRVAAGMACSPKVDAESCNMDACEKDCVLSDWTDWSTTCSKQCGIGQQTRFKTVSAPEAAGGKCAHFYDESRFQTTQCNVEPCPHTKKTVTCRAQVDVVLLIDGSASMGAAGFAAAKQFAENFAGTLSAPAQLATLVFSGPDDVNTLNTCEGETQGDVTIAQCGMNWVSHLSSDFGTAATSIKTVDYPAATALTSMALHLAAGEFMKGAANSQAVAILLTDGMPVRKYPMAQAVDALKAHARFMEIVVGRDAYADAAEFKGWGSDPWHENVRFVDEWNTLISSNETLNDVIEDFCADMVFDKSS